MPARPPAAARPTPSSPSSRRPSRQPRQPALQVQGSLWIEAGGRSLGGHGRMALLQAVAEHGSITHAARAFGMSYKAAWDAIDLMNTLSGTPLVERVTGGKGGGGTRLTAHGQRLIERYRQLDDVHQRFVRLLTEQGMDLSQDFSLLKVLNVKTSARNQWVGVVSAIRAGAVNDEVEVMLPGGVPLVATITRESTDHLQLRLQQTVIAMVKAPAVLLATGLDGARVSARNRLDGHVQAVQPGAVNAEVTVGTPTGLEVVAVVTQGSVQALQLAPGLPVTALVKASDVILATVS